MIMPTKNGSFTCFYLNLIFYPYFYSYLPLNANSCFFHHTHEPPNTYKEAAIPWFTLLQ